MSSPEANFCAVVIFALALIALGVWSINDKLKEIIKRLDDKK